MEQTSVADSKLFKTPKPYDEKGEINLAADPVYQYMTKEKIQKAIDQNKKAMQRAAKELDFIEAARYRDEIAALEKML